MVNNGYINHPKGIAFSKNGSKTLAYYVGHDVGTTGKKLVIQIAEQQGTTFSNPLSTFSPMVPYRIIIGDSRTIKDLEVNNGFSSQTIGGNLLYNPGITVDGNGILGNIPTLGYNGQVPYIELNVTRDQLNKLTQQNRIWQRKQILSGANWIASNDFSILYDTISYYAEDIRASIIVNNIDADYDELVISVTPTITINGLFYESSLNTLINSTKIKKFYSYSLPVLLRFVVSRNSLPSGTVRPSSWRYLFPISAATNDTSDSYGISKIENTYGVNFGTNSCAYNLIANKPFLSRNNNTTYRFLYPLNLGCMWDIVYNSISNKYLGISSVAGYTSSGIKDSRIKPIHINGAELIVAGFGTTYTNFTQAGFNSEQNNHIGFANSIATSDGGSLTAITSSNGVTSIDKTLLIYYNSTTMKFVTIQYAGNSSLSYLNGSILLTYYQSPGNTLNVISVILPSVSYFSSLVQTKSFDLRDIKAVNIKSNCEFFSEAQVYYYPEYIDLTSYQSYEAKISSYMFSRYCEDQSIFPGTNINPSLCIKTTAISESHLEIDSFSNLSELKIKIVPSYGTDFNPLGIAYKNVSNISDTSYFRVRNYADKLFITSYDINALNISGAASIGFWANTNLDYTEGQGVKATFMVNGCSGIFRQGNGTISDWKPALPGVPVNLNYIRPDLSFSYGGSFENFKTDPSGHYWAVLTKPTSTLSLVYLGKELVKNPGGIAFIEYNLSGNFNIHWHMYLDLEGVLDGMGRLYTDANFSLNAVPFVLTINTIDPIVFQGILDIDPPNPNGIIETSSVIYKTVSPSVDFSMTRDAVTSIRFITLSVNNQNTSNITPNLYTGVSNLTATIPVSTLNFKNGDNFAIKYKPLVNDSRCPDISSSSRLVTFVKGHKYSIDNVKILIDSVDKTSEISNSSSSWLYVNPGVANINVKVEFDVNHMSYTQEIYGALERVYPVIAKIYMMVVPKFNLPPVFSAFPFVPITTFEELPPIGYPTTYPNCSYAGADILYLQYTTATYKDDNTHGGSTISLTSEALSTNVAVDGNYQIYLIVEDEFGQRSAWCVTNLKNNYRIPFGRT